MQRDAREARDTRDEGRRAGNAVLPGLLCGAVGAARAGRDRFGPTRCERSSAARARVLTNGGRAERSSPKKNARRSGRFAG